MKHRFPSRTRKLLTFCGLSLALSVSHPMMGQPAPAAIAAFNSYSSAVESRLAREHRSPNTFLAPISSSQAPETQLRQGELVIERVKEPLDELSEQQTSQNLSGVLLHHWRGTAFASGAQAADFERLMRDVNSYPQHFSPQVLQAKASLQSGDRMQTFMRVRQKHVITIVMDTNYDITFGQLDPQHGYSISRSTRIAEVDAPGTAAERTLTANQEHGFLWRLNTYWTYEERNGGLYLQIEAVSLTRSIPSGLGWAIRPYVESIPRESLEFTLRSTCNALRR